MNENNCIFCMNFDSPKRNIIMEHGGVYAINDSFPVSENHLLILPKRHVESFFDLTIEERRDADWMVFFLKEKIASEDKSVTGFNIGVNCGLSAGQTIMHAHIHLIPRRDGDCVDPTGGVRCVIPEKMKYETNRDGIKNMPS